MVRLRSSAQGMVAEGRAELLRGAWWMLVRWSQRARCHRRGRHGDGWAHARCRAGVWRWRRAGPQPSLLGPEPPVALVEPVALLDPVARQLRLSLHRFARELPSAPPRRCAPAPAGGAAATGSPFVLQPPGPVVTAPLSHLIPQPIRRLGPGTRGAFRSPREGVTHAY